MQKIILGVLAIVAAAGWAAAYVFFTESGDLTERLAGVEAERAKVESALDDARSDLRKQTDSAGSLGEIEKKLGAAEANSIVLEKQLQAKRTELAAVTREIESQKLELSKLERELAAKATSLESAEQDAELAMREVERLRAESAELAQTAEQLREGVPAGAAAPATATPPAETMAKLESQPGAAEPPAMDRQSRIERSFKLLDKNSDGGIDEFEFRLNSVRLLGLLDTNDDGAVTRDETLLPPDRFRLFDQDGDGKIAPIEFIEAFRILDRDDKGVVTQKDYEAFIESAAK